MMIPFCWIQFTEVQWQQFDLSQFASLGFIVIAATFLAYYFNVYGILHLGAGVAGSYIYTQPIFAVIIATIFLNEPLNFQKIIAGVLIFAGVYLVSLRK
jgi:drug/metabolite transporter (DMT)-like permease